MCTFISPGSGFGRSQYRKFSRRHDRGLIGFIRASASQAVRIWHDRFVHALIDRGDCICHLLRTSRPLKVVPIRFALGISRFSKVPTPNCIDTAAPVTLLLCGLWLVLQRGKSSHYGEPSSTTHCQSICLFTEILYAAAIIIPQRFPLVRYCQYARAFSVTPAVCSNVGPISSKLLIGSSAKAIVQFHNICIRSDLPGLTVCRALQ
jgi:hypothetical protein